MTEIVLVRQPDIEITDAEKDAARRVMFGAIDGLGERGQKQWRRFMSALFRLAPGEMVTIKTHRERSGPYHRRHMAMEARIFESQVRFSEFEQFRNWLKIGAGHVDWAPGPKGAVVPIPKSISFANLEDDKMREVHEAMVRFLRTEHAARALWPHLKEHAWKSVESILEEFGE